jgi:uncharacterized protein YcaQ
MTSLTWEQVSSWRLRQHHLLERASPKQLLEVVSAVGGIHAQMTSAAELQLWARMDGISPNDVQEALWEKRRLVKTWAMRGTLHLINARDFAIYIAARAAFTIKRPPSYYTYHGVTPEELEAIKEGIPHTLNAEPKTREQLAEALAGWAGSPQLREVLLSGWGALLKPSAFRGDLCFGPNQGQNVTFVLPRSWIGDWQSVDPQEAMQEMARRYLQVYGPATVDDFAHWWGLQGGKAKKVFQGLGEEIQAVEVQGWEAWALAESLPEMQKLDRDHCVRLLPNFDPYVIAAARHSSYLLDEQNRGRVYRPQGWISPVVLVDGRMEGVWDNDKGSSGVTVRVEMFTPPSPRIKQGVEAEGERLEKFWDTEVIVEIH